MVKFINNSKIIKAQMNEAYKRAAKEIALEMEGIAKENSPVDTGNLRSKIYGESGKKNGDIIARVGTNTEYASFQEFGTSKMEAQPFIRPARDEMQRESANIVKKHMKGVGK